VIENFRDGKHAFRLGSDIDDDVGRGQFHHAAFDYVVFAGCLFGFGLEVLQGGREIVAASRGRFRRSTFRSLDFGGAPSQSLF
jgi:hypothetical protein